MSVFKRGLGRVGWRVSPEAMAALEEMRAYRDELHRLQQDVSELKRDIDEQRSDSRRIAELTDVLVTRLAELERPRSPDGD